MCLQMSALMFLHVSAHISIHTALCMTAENGHENVDTSLYIMSRHISTHISTHMYIPLFVTLSLHVFIYMSIPVSIQTSIHMSTQRRSSSLSDLRIHGAHLRRVSCQGSRPARWSSRRAPDWMSKATRCLNLSTWHRPSRPLHQ